MQARALGPRVVFSKLLEILYKFGLMNLYICAIASKGRAVLKLQNGRNSSPKEDSGLYNASQCSLARKPKAALRSETQQGMLVRQSCDPKKHFSSFTLEAPAPCLGCGRGRRRPGSYISAPLEDVSYTIPERQNPRPGTVR
ncbi:hypothetical protein SKAU_G00149860 [Synaphobranchus kaupii]|uniref:Uncharacterized protein n=1 Tax=Synaphobranchus kaupii TaxID=118154 RepID=A0A9Q1J590_SYNKA|nr:hypothetical protein SKAU_G00149860 [Synaphobranchus kaupii]